MPYDPLRERAGQWQASTLPFRQDDLVCSGLPGQECLNCLPSSRKEVIGHRTGVYSVTTGFRGLLSARSVEPPGVWKYDGSTRNMGPLECFHCIGRTSSDSFARIQRRQSVVRQTGERHRFAGLGGCGLRLIVFLMNPNSGIPRDLIIPWDILGKVRAGCK